MPPARLPRSAARAAERDGAARALRGEDPARLLRFYQQMMLIRRFEERAAEMYQRARIGGYCHLNLGEEATCVGLIAAMRPEDYLFTNYREHGYALARGLEPCRVMAELFGRRDGVAGGRGGSMHLFDSKVRLMGGYAIVGGQLPLATGAALAIAQQGLEEVVVCQMGDATTNIGSFHESLNLAAIWRLPVVFAIVNNNYGMGTPVERASAVTDLWKKACAYDMPGEQLDGNDPLVVRDGVGRALERARKKRQPSLLDIRSFRIKGHSVVDPDRYRSPDELQRGRAQDPVPAFARRLISSRIARQEQIQQLEREAEDIVAEAVQFADASPEPDPKDLFQFDYATAVENAPRFYPGQSPLDGVP